VRIVVDVDLSFACLISRSPPRSCLYRGSEFIAAAGWLYLLPRMCCSDRMKRRVSKPVLSSVMSVFMRKPDAGSTSCQFLHQRLSSRCHGRLAHAVIAAPFSIRLPLHIPERRH
jgi:hypothetical protein